MTIYNITINKLLSEYMNFDINCGQRFGEYIFNNYVIQGYPDSEVYYENNNGVAYKMILNRIYQQDLKNSS